MLTVIGVCVRKREIEKLYSPHNPSSISFEYLKMEN